MKKSILNCEKKKVKRCTSWVGDTMVYPSEDPQQEVKTGGPGAAGKT